MALFNCPECNKEISSQAQSCPNCGLPLKSKVIEWDIENENKKKQEKDEFLKSLGEIKTTNKKILKNRQSNKVKKHDTSWRNFFWFLGATTIFMAIALSMCDNNNESYYNNELSQQNDNSADVLIKYSKTSLNVRRRPNENSSVLKVLKPNEKIITKGDQKNGFTQILNSNNQNYGWCASRFLQDSPLSKNELKELDSVKSSGYRLIEKKDMSLADFKGMNYKIRLNAKTIPNEDLLKNTAQTIWQNGNKHWEEFYVSVYLTDMSTKGEAYCVLDYTSNGFEGVTYNTEREIGSGIKSYVPAWKNIDNSIGSFTDSRDGKNYKTVKIGTQTWMAENLAYKNSSGCWAYDNKESNVTTYGYLYDWETAKNVCPTGWHLPSDAEWTQLTNYLGGEKVAGGKLKETGTTHWKSPNKGATNETGFTAIPGGSCFSTGAFFAIGGYGYWWSATEATEAGAAWFRTMFDYANDVVRDYGFGNEMGLSVRCLKTKENINSTNEIKKEFDVAEVDKKYNNSGFVDPFSLKPGEKWSISRKTPLMPEIAPSNPMEALEKVKYIPAENYIIIVSVREKENNTWYAVEVLNQNNDLIGKGWINSIALIGQTLQLVN